jgi:integrase
MLRGKEIFESSRSPDIRVAETLLRRRKTEIADGRVVIGPGDAPFFSVALQTYIDQIENPNTAKRYRLSAATLLEYIGECRISQLTAFDFDKFKSQRLEAGVTPAGVNRELALARAALNFTVERRLIPYSPFAGVKLFNEATHRKQPFILSFALELSLLACCDLRLRTLIVLLVETGLRVGIEALGLGWEDVDFGEGTITVQHSKTVAGRRVIPMSSYCKSALQEWHSVVTGMSEFVFFNPQDPTRHIHSVKTAWRNALRASGIPPFPLYCARHTFATRLAAAGVTDAIIDQLLGHARRDILSHYTARVLEYLRDAISRLEDLRGSKEATLAVGDGKLRGLPNVVKGSDLIQ